MVADIQVLKESANLPAIVENLTGYPGRKGLYHCPICGSGSGPKHSGAFHVLPDSENQNWYCHSCHRYGDVLDLAGYILKTDDFTEKRRQVMEWAGITEDEISLMVSPKRERNATPRSAMQQVATETGQTSQNIERERARIKSARAAINDPEAIAYLEGRGVDTKAAHALGLGYDVQRKRIVIPYPGSDYYHTDRAIDRDGHGKYHKPKGMAQPLWNPQALERDYILVVEGPMDALALTLAGYGSQTVALAGTAWHKLVEELRARNYQGTVLVALDADKAGERARDELLRALDEAKIKASAIAVWKELGAKDASEAWERDQEAMREAVAAAVDFGTREAEKRREKAEQAAYEATMERLHVVKETTAIVNVYEMDGAVEPIPTGFAALDETLGGGMSPGLYVLGATSSLGKTTFIGQIADHMAIAGYPVLFVSLEMSAEEMAAKSLSRYIATHPGPDSMPREESARNFMRPSWRQGRYCGPDMEAAIRDACNAIMRATEERLCYLVADSEPTVADVATVAHHMASAHGRPPVVFIDYLQLLKSPEGSLSDKQATDRNVSTLRRLGRDLKTSVVAISSLNRAGYWGAVTMEAFKESGAIEYGSDVLMGIQPYKMGSDLDECKNEKEATKKGRKIINESKSKSMVREIEVTVLKNRWGKITGYNKGVHLTYHTIGNYFVSPNEKRPFYAPAET